jgi:asparagine synthase (glutamine-hydrolysing)
MCGIVGTVNAVNSFNLNSIKHRGPDDKGVFEEGNVKLGHVRLSIQDLSERGHQPFVSQDGKYLIIFNGEIYNHWELRADLEKAGHTFVSTSDTETVLIGYMVYGVDIIPKLNGIFAFGIFEKQTGKLVVARDRFGVKPLYYFLDKKSFGFTSELKALLDCVPKPVHIDEESLFNYIRFLWSPGEGTPIKEIKKLLPGRYITINVNDLSSARVVQYYKSGFSSAYIKKSENEIIDTLENYLREAVKRQLLSDVPVGFFLSGGLDSSILVAIAKKIEPAKKLQCFTIEAVQEHAANTDDLAYAKKVANYLDVDLEIVKADVEIVKDFDKMIFHLDEPQADAAPLNVLNISRRAREMGYKVLIGGTAGDDIFSGYRRHQALRYESVLKNIPLPIKKLLLKVSQGTDTMNPKFRRIKKVLNTLAYDDDVRMYSYFEWLSNENTMDLFTDKLKDTLQHKDPFWYFKHLLSEIPEERNKLNQLLHLEMNSFLVDHNLNYTDKMGMAVGVEIRVPFLDNDLVDFSFRIPPELKMKGNETKYILKKVAERYLPHDVIYRDKTGFGAPVRKWITEDLDDMIHARLSQNKIRERGIFDPGKVRDLIQKNKEHKIDASYSIWALLAIESWLQQFYDAKSVGKENHSEVANH